MNGSKRTISRILAFVMLVSAMFTNVITANADVNDVSLIDSVVSSAAAVVDEIVDDGVEDLAAATGDVLPENIVTVGESLATGKYCDDQVEIVDKAPETLADDGEWTVSGNEGNDTITTPNGTVTYSHFVQGSNNPKSADGKKSYNKDGQPVIPEQGAYIIVTPKVKSTLTMDLKINGKSKNYAFMSVDSEGNAKQIEFVTTGAADTDAQFVRKEYTVEPGLTYYVTGAGSKYCLYGLQLVAAEEDTPSTTVTETSTQPTTAEPTTTTTEPTTTTAEPTTTTVAEANPETSTAAPVGGGDEDSDRTDWNFDGTDAGLHDGTIIQGEIKMWHGLRIDTLTGKVDEGDDPKFDTSNPKWVQVNAKTIIGIPVSGPSNITVTTYSANVPMTINGESVSSGAGSSVTYKYDPAVATVAAVTYVDLVMGANDYIGSLKVEPIAVEPAGPFDWAPVYEEGKAPLAANDVIGSAKGVTITALCEWKYEQRTETDGPLVFGDVSAFDRVKSNCSNAPATLDGVSKNYRVVAKVSAEKPASVSVAMSIMAKNIVFAKMTDENTYVTDTVVCTPDSTAGVGGMINLNVKPGEDLYLIGDGTNPEIYGMNVTVLQVADDADSYTFWLDDFAEDITYFATDGAYEVGATENAAGNKFRGIPGSKDGFEVTKNGSTLKLIPSLAANHVDYTNTAKPDAFPAVDFTALGGKVASIFKSSNRPDNAGKLTAIPEAGSCILFTPGADGLINFYYAMASGKAFALYDFVGGSLVDSTLTNFNGSNWDPQMATFKVVGGHQYLITPTNTNDFASACIDFVINKPVTASIKWSKDAKLADTDVEGVEVSFVDEGTGEVLGPVVYGAADVTLMDGHVYSVITSDAGVGAGFGDAVDTAAETFKVEGAAEVPIIMIQVPDVTLAGNIVADNEEDVKKVSAVKFVSMKDATKEFPAVLNADGSYTATLKPGEYNTVITADGVSTIDRVSVKADTENKNDIYVVSTAPKTYPSEYKSELTVPGDYATLTEANAAIEAMDRADGQRVTINLADDIFEQVHITEPDITINGNGHTISWYYGVSGVYYSVDTNGYYNHELFMDKYSTNGASGSLWGGVVIVEGNNFKAVNTTFLNTFNDRITDKDKEDCVESAAFPDGRANATDEDVRAYKAKERANALYIKAKNIEITDCKILSNQDTLGLNGGSLANGYSAYFKNCVIRGTTDYICGGFSAVFDDCELQWFSYPQGDTNNPKIGYIVAPKDCPYVFRNCNVTTTGAEGTDLVQGQWGRTWGANSNATFINCQTNNHIIENKGWGEMNTGDGTSAYFKEYGNKNGDADFTTTNDLGIDTTLDPANPEDKAVIENLESDGILDTVYGGGEAGSGWIPDAYDLDFSGWGDVDNDGHITAVDASLTLQYVLAPANVAGKQFYKERADITGDGKIDSADVAMILQQSLDSNYKGTAPGKAPEPVETNPAVLYVLGDSTACHYILNDQDPAYAVDPATGNGNISDPGYLYQRVGFGDGFELGGFFDTNMEVKNLGLSGRSSKSFATGINEGGHEDAEAKANYAAFKEGIVADKAAGKDVFVIIAWGHNDEKLDAYRGTKPAKTPGDKTEEGSFEKSLYDNYVKVALDAGATPILASPIVRRVTAVDVNNNTTWNDNSLHITGSGDYGAAVKALAEAENIAFIDNLALTKEYYERVTPGAQASTKPTDTVKTVTPATGSALLHAASIGGSTDNTHLNKYGAIVVAGNMARAMKTDEKLSALAEHIVTTKIPPENEGHSIAVNPDWVPFDQSKYESESKDIWNIPGPEWEAAVFGNGTGAESLTQDDHGAHTIEELETGKKVRIAIMKNGEIAGSDKGKFESGGDGLDMYFKQIGANENFELEADMTMNDFDGAGKQIGFGLMCRDNVFTKSSDKTATDWAAVGYFINDGGKVQNYVMRAGYSPEAGGTLGRGPTVTQSVDEYANIGLVKGNTVHLKLKRVDGVYTVKFNNGDDITFDGFDTTDASGAVTGHTKIDTSKCNADTDFVGVFANRAADITFDNITYTKLN